MNDTILIVKTVATDVVPHLPLELMNFEHAPTEVWYQEDNTDFQVCYHPVRAELLFSSHDGSVLQSSTHLRHDFVVFVM